MRKKFRSILLGVLSFIMLFQTTITTVMATEVGGDSNSNDFRSEFIKIKQGQSISDVDVNAITAEELRLIALYISNFYVPMSTTLEQDDEDEVRDKTIDALVDACGFDEDMAEILVDLCMQYSLETAKPLYTTGKYKSGDKEYCVTPGDLSSDLTGRNEMTSLGEEYFSLDTDGTTKLPDGIYKFTYGYFLAGGASNCDLTAFWADDDIVKGEDNVVFGTNEYVRNAYAMIADHLNYTNGIGSSFWSVNENTIANLDDSQLMKATSIYNPLYVDWVGNIIVDDGVNRYILMPACYNPYVFKGIGESQGNKVNMVNLRGLDKVKSSEARLEDNSVEIAFYVGDGSLLDLDEYWWRVSRGEGGDKSNQLYFDHAIIGSSSREEELIGWANRVGFDVQKIAGKNDEYIFPRWTGIAKGDSVDGKKDLVWSGSFISCFAECVLIDDIQLHNWTKDFNKYFHSYHLKDEKSGGNGKRTNFSSISDFGTLVSISNADSTDLWRIYTTYLFAYSNYQKGSTSFNEEENLINMEFCGDIFPQVKGSIDWGKVEVKEDKIGNEIKSFIYYLLHPSKGMHYVATWLKNKISAFFLGWHEDMVGASNSNASTGMTRYIGFTGYTTLPSLSDLPWTAWLLENYNSIIVYLIIIISIILCCYIIVGSMSGQQAIIGAVMFAFLAFIPPFAINTVVNIVNRTCDSIYSSKFSYWALVQHQSYLQDLYSASNGTDEEYTEWLLKTQSEGSGAESSGAGYTSVKLKWMSPKKDNYLAGMTQELEDKTKTKDGSSTVVNNLFGGMASKATSGQEFIDDPEALYLYRDYMNITMYSLKSYNIYDYYFGGTTEGKNTVSLGSGDYRNQIGAYWSGTSTTNDGRIKIKYKSGVDYNKLVLSNIEADGAYNTKVPTNSDLKKLSSIEAIRKGFLYNTFGSSANVNSKQDYYHSTSLATTLLLNFGSAYDDMVRGYESLSENLKNGTTVIGKDYLRGYGLPQSGFTFSHSNLSNIESKDYGDKSKLDYFYYSLYSESPYYFFSYNILDQMRSTDDVNYKFSYAKTSNTSLQSGFKNLVLGDNLDYFFNYSENSGDGYGELRDFMNMHDLFYYVIPLMNYGDEFVEVFDRAYGMQLYDDVKVRFTPQGDVQVSSDDKTYIIGDIKTMDGTSLGTVSNSNTIKYADLVKDWTDEKIFKFWHNYNVTIMYNAYCTWVDTMFDCNYAKSETISVAGKKFKVVNPLDPTSYFRLDSSGNKIVEGRQMVFSRSEMKYMGLKWSDLTQVEQKIINVQDSVYEKSIDLLNYYTFDDDVLVSAYAMLQLFEFNKEFSQTSLFGEDFVMYPQSYELKAFTYDAYLRLIIANTTGDNLQIKTNESLYDRTMKNTSITFGIILIVLDVIAVYIIPAFKLFFLIALFILSIMMIVASAVKIELNMVQVVWKSLLQPLLSFSAVSIGLAFIVSLFMYNGEKGVTGDTTPTVQLGDPTMVIIVMVVINAVAVYLYFKICRKTGKEFIKYAKAIANNIGGTVAGALRRVTGLAMAGKAVSGIRKDIRGVYDANQNGKSNVEQNPKLRGEDDSNSNPSTGGGNMLSAAGGALGGAMLANGMHEAENNSNSRSTEDYNNKINKGKDNISETGGMGKARKEKINTSDSIDNYKSDLQSNSRTQKFADKQKVKSDMSWNKAQVSAERTADARKNFEDMKKRREAVKQYNGGKESGVSKVVNTMRVKGAELKYKVSSAERDVRVKVSNISEKKSNVANRVNTVYSNNKFVQNRRNAKAGRMYVKNGVNKNGSK